MLSAWLKLSSSPSGLSLTGDVFGERGGEVVMAATYSQGWDEGVGLESCYAGLPLGRILGQGVGHLCTAPVSVSSLRL